jgi:protein-L-isoaspartate(D-aspartate) O-methyltransferase
MLSRDALIDEIAAEFAETARWTGCPHLPPDLGRALSEVPREAFVPVSDRALAYANAPLPIGHRQTISQPYIVAVMTALLGVKPGDRVLEIGTGSGYQAAILATLGARVFSVEVVPELAAQAEATLRRLGYDVALRLGDGSAGWAEQAPYEAIIATAAPADIPPALIEQLAPGGRMVIPLGPAGGEQTLYVIDKDSAGRLSRRATLPVAFVPMVG